MPKLYISGMIFYVRPKGYVYHLYKDCVFLSDRQFENYKYEKRNLTYILKHDLPLCLACAKRQKYNNQHLFFKFRYNDSIYYRPGINYEEARRNLRLELAINTRDNIKTKDIIALDKKGTYDTQ